MRDVVGAVAAAHVVDHLEATLIVEVHIDIGHLGTLGRQESLEHEAVLEGVEGGDVHGVGHDGAGGRATAGPHADAVLLGPLHVVGHDEEVGGKALVADDLVLVLEALHHVGAGGLVVLAVVAAQARLGVAAELALVGLSLVKAGVARQDDLVKVEVDAGLLVEHVVGAGAALHGDLDRVVAGLLVDAQGRAHLLLGLHVELVVLEPHAVGVVDLLVHADAHHGVLGGGVFLQEIVEVVGGDGLEAELLGQGVEVAVELHLGHARVGSDALVLQLDVEVVVAKDAAEGLGPLDRRLAVTAVEALWDDARDAGGGGDDAVVVVAQHVDGHAGLVVEAARGRLRDDVHEVDVALVVFGQQQHVVELRLAVARKGCVGGEVDLAAEDGLDAVLGTLAPVRAAGDLCVEVPLGAAVHVAVVGDGAGRHAELPGALGHIFEARNTVEQRVFRVVVQVDKGHVRSPPGQGAPCCASLCRDMRVGYEDLSLTYACSFIVGHTT